MKKKEMRYFYDESLLMQGRELLAEDTDGDYSYVILSHSVYPVVYIRLPKTYNGADYETSKRLLSDFDRYLDVHGGVTFFGEELNTGEPSHRKGVFLGWTYNTAADYVAGIPFEDHAGGKRWTTSELIAEAKNAIKQLKIIQENV